MSGRRSDGAHSARHGARKRDGGDHALPGRDRGDERERHDASFRIDTFPTRKGSGVRCTWECATLGRSSATTETE